jgi:hypothetical protein
MLGGMAYQDPEHASIKDLDLRNLSKINAEISDTAVDIVVYDTRKDSDGGAWRKRTQDTSWYNETLGTSDRGTRREFPAVAVIVATENDVIIYDGDDPDLPMWMIFKSSDTGYPYDTHYLGRGSGFSGFHPSITSIAMLNGILVVGKDGDSTNYAECFTEIKFISDRAFHIDETNAVDMPNPISERNGNAGGRLTKAGIGFLAHFDILDLDMTVLPNAPIDDETGLPVPTIAVASLGGVTIIRDDNTTSLLSDNTGTDREYQKVTMIGSDVIGYNHPNGTVQRFFDALDVYSNSDNDMKYNYTYDGGGGSTENISAVLRKTINTTIGVVGNENNSPTTFNADGISKFIDGSDRNFTANSFSIYDSAVAHITSNYNTGYMPGDIERVLMSDTTAESLTANTNLATNFVYGSTSRLSSLDYDSGDLSWQMVDNAGTTNGYLVIAMAGLTIGQTYHVSMTWDNNATLDSGYYHQVIHKNGLSGETSTKLHHWDKTNGSSETLTAIFTAQSVNDDDLLIYANAITLNITNFNVRAVDDEDRSIKNKGIAVQGTLTKSAVATGADLVAYSGFSASNYLIQPYDSEIAPGASPYSVMCWFKTGTSGGDQYIFDRSASGNGSRNLLLIMSSAASGSNPNKFQWWHRDASGNVSDVKVTDKIVTDNQWHQVVAIYSGISYEVYIDGELSTVTNSTVRSVGNDGNPPMYIGVRHTQGSTYMTGSMALFRYSMSAPSASQIKKMYDEEKILFQENSKATLYGSSDAVTAAAFDDTTNIFHAGTSAGRSEFRGLRRINNTTTAVTTAISASNGLVAEQ